MVSGDPVNILIRADAWATRQVLGACAALRHEDFHRVFPMGIGSLHDTLVHTISATRRWTDRVADRTPRPWLYTPRSAQANGVNAAEAREYSVAALLALVDDAEADALAVVREWSTRLGTTVHAEWPSGPNDDLMRYTFSRGAVVMHMCTHGFHHRAQCLNMLRQLGEAGAPGVPASLPQSSVTSWQGAVEAPPVLVRKADT